MRTTGRAGSVGVRPLGLLVALALVGAACSNDGPAIDVSASEPVSFPSSDGVRLEGQLFGDGTSAVVLSHMRPADQRSWFALADRLADAGYLVLTFNFRGYCPGGEDGGCSEGETEIGAIWQDVLGAIGFVRDRGAGRVALIGASMGGTASLVAASQQGVEVDAVITLSAPASIDGLVVDRDVLTRISGAKLFVAGVGDAAYARDAESLFALAPQPKRVEILPSDAHGTDLLTGGQGEVVARLIETQLERAGGP